MEREEGFEPCQVAQRNRATTHTNSLQTLGCKGFRPPRVSTGFFAGPPDSTKPGAHLASFKQPSIFARSWGFTVKTFVHYTVTEVRTGAVLLDEDIGAEHSQWFWPLLGYKRLQAANEGSARKNVAALIERMNQIRPAPAAAPSM